MNLEVLSVAEALQSLRSLTECCCQYPYPIADTRHHPHCRHDWAEDVEVLAGAIAAIEVTPEKLNAAAREARAAFHAPGREPFPSDARWTEVVRAVIVVLEKP
jgi:hypothetical protein